MNLSSLNPFCSLRREDSRQFAVIGLGRFGRAVCSSLHSLGYEVLGVDVNKKNVCQVANEHLATHTLQLDSTDPTALKEAGIFELHTVIVAIGNFLEESVITTLNLKEGGVQYVVAKASSEVHCKLLRLVGADHVVYPEHEAGCTLARSLTRPGIVELLELDLEHSVVELIVPEEFDGKAISELKLRSRYGLTLLAVTHNGKFEINPDPNRRLHKGSIMVVVGSNKAVERLPV